MSITIDQTVNVAIMVSKTIDEEALAVIKNKLVQFRLQIGPICKS